MRIEAHPWTRRRFLGSTGLASIAGLGSASVVSGRSQVGASEEDSRRENIYEALGIRPLINAAGTYTALSASLMPREVVMAMEEASRMHVSIPELHLAVGERIASLVGAPSVLVTSGCAAALTLATAACVCGKDQEKIKQIPDTSGMKDEIVIQKSHRFVYDHALRAVGVKLIEVETRRELEGAINQRTAMLFFLNQANNRGRIQHREFVEVARKAAIPSLIDAAADLPPVENLWAFTRMGFDLVAFSGGKGLRGPQCSGLLIGRKDLIEAATANGSPHADSIGRIAKVGKEEIVGLMRAVELYLSKDHEAEWEEWESRVSDIAEAVSGIRGVRTERFVPEIANQVPHLVITWNPDVVRFTREDAIRALREGEPRIEVRPSGTAEPRIEIAVWMMRPGEHRIVARRSAEVLSAAV